jgi:hypothetical protein
MLSAITTTNESETVIAYTHAALPGIKVQASPDDPKNEASQWSAFASGHGCALTAFAGKSFANQKSMDKAVRRWLDGRANA